MKNVIFVDFRKRERTTREPVNPERLEAVSDRVKALNYKLNDTTLEPETILNLEMELNESLEFLQKAGF